MILVLYIECTTTKILLLLKGSHHEPSKQSDENRASKRAREWQHHKKKNLVPCKAFLIRVRSSSSVLRRGWVCQKNELWFSPLLLFVAIFGSHSRGGAFESWTLWARRPTLWGIHLAICESQQSPHSSQISLQGTSRKLILLPFAFQFHNLFVKYEW